MSYFLDHAPGFIGMGVTIFLAFKVQKIHLDINSRLDQWRKDTREAGIAEGKLAGQAASHYAAGKAKGASDERKQSQRMEPPQ